MSPPCCRIRCKDYPVSGKASSRIEYAYRFAADYDIVWWIPSEARAAARQSLADLAIRLDLGGQAAETGELIRAVLDALRTGQPYQRWLLIFDNVGAPEDIGSLLLSGPGHTLVTSRDQSWASQADVLDVDVYTREESTKFLQRRLRGLSLADASRLAEELADLPLALEHAAGWLSTTQMSADDYLSLLREHIAELFDPARAKDYPASIRTTWTVSMNQLREQNPAAEELLNLCAFIGPDPIPLSLLTARPPEALPAALREALISPFQRAKILRDIRSYSLARVSEAAGEGPFAGPSLQQHRLVQAVVRDVVSADEREAYRKLAHQLLAAADPGDPGASRELACLRSAAAARAVLRSGHRYRSGRPPPDASRGPGPMAARRIPNVPEPGHRRGARHGPGPWMRPIRTCSWRAGNEATRCTVSASSARRWNRTARSTTGSSVAWATITLTRSGRPACSPAAAARMGNFLAAQELDKHAMTVAIRDRGRDDPETLRLAHNVAVNYRMVGEFTAALDIDRYNAEVTPGFWARTRSSSLFAINNVARDLRECGQYYEALSLQENTYSRYREVFGPDNPETLRAMKNLAVGRRKAGRYAEAAALAEDVLNRHRRKFGDLNPETLAATTNFANDHRCLVQYLTGRGFAELALRGFREVFGDDNAFTACAAVNLAALIRLTGGAGAGPAG